MNTKSDFDRQATAWLADGPTELNDRVLDAALRKVHRTPQRRRWSAPWRASLMKFRLGAAALIAIVAVAGLLALNQHGSNVGPPIAGTPSPVPATTPSRAPSATVPPTVSGPIDTTTWVAYTSTRYGFTIGHPANWSVVSSNHNWAFPSDATDFPPAAGEEFNSPAGDVAVSAWSLALTPGTSLAAWLQTYCALAEADSPCSAALSSGTTSVSMDGHPGLLVKYRDDTQAYILIGDQLYVVACWRADTDPSVLTYGGGARFLEGYLSTMHLLPALPATTAPTVRPS